MGKDNIIFHSIILPSILLGKGELNLPHNIPANEYLNLEGLKLSSSRNWALWVNELSEIYEPDSIRYSLASNFPEKASVRHAKGISKHPGTEIRSAMSTSKSDSARSVPAINRSTIVAFHDARITAIRSPLPLSVVGAEGRSSPLAMCKTVAKGDIGCY